MRAAFFVGEEAYDLTKVVDPVWQGGASQGHIKSRESAPVQEPVKPCLVYVEAHVLSTVVDSIDLSQPGAWNIDGREVAFQVEEAVHDITIVLAVASYNLAAAIKPCGQGVKGSWNIDSGYSGSTQRTHDFVIHPHRMN